MKRARANRIAQLIGKAIELKVRSADRSQPIDKVLSQMDLSDKKLTEVAKLLEGV